MGLQNLSGTAACRTCGYVCVEHANAFSVALKPQDQPNPNFIGLRVLQNVQQRRERQRPLKFS